MKKRLLFLLALTLTAFTSKSAQADHQYFSGMAGISWIPSIHINNTNSSFDYMDHYSLKPTAALSGAIGYNFGNYRLEGEIGYQKNNFKSVVFSGTDEHGAPFSDASYPMKGDVSVISLMANGYYDFKLGSNINIYAMAGAGGANVSFNNVAMASDNYVNNINAMSLAYQVGVGVTKPITDHILLDLRYRYFKTSDMTVNWDYKGNDFNNNTAINTHSVLLGMRFEL